MNQQDYYRTHHNAGIKNPMPVLISNCCSYPAGEYEDIGICPACHEHCDWILEGEDDERFKR